jgi:polyhydroxyalkanoate synthesis repressor PhaR
MLIKKYGNRRLYDTENSRYITLEDLAAMVKGGDEPRIVDAKTGSDLTQATLAQIILESRRASRLLPVPLLTQMIRMRDDALAEFLGRYMTGALEMYLQARQGAQTLAPLNPFANLPFAAGNALARMFGAGSMPSSSGMMEPQPAGGGPSTEMAEMRRELDALKKTVRGRKKRR